MKKFTPSARLRSFKYAFDGLKTLFADEPNAWIHLSAAVSAVTAGFLLHISSNEWLAVIICIGIVFAVESFNTALENLCDKVSPERNDVIRKVKDLAAAAVLVVSIASFITGLIIFVPKIG
ncbi:MAG: diacylglycerol kinase family protein [Tannerella sp.]|jgi:diacylglycerol kinase|nr:diacylglycerol kinase family protein [Tannerella sp.]